MSNIEVISAVDPNPGAPCHPGRVTFPASTPATDFMAAPDRWVGPSTDIRKRKPLSNECLAALTEAARTKGRMLKDEERADILKNFQ